ncbi:hypothetical protein Rsub_13224 [Raphidocelis subcapitata]|uniref:CARDB domain-containing protein n=1 Tax=Raphidocelis subcapitata TaxID=307507 RepID=A0A2V0PSX1_9CHLO|nr:hypothetical protein Rsub_13224 [Raphidocelis subcapitata]|eukprot:GBG00446.1 hypothetical protein Rsub_13224 [Raphidocelis subcapitata]
MPPPRPAALLAAAGLLVLLAGVAADLPQDVEARIIQAAAAGPAPSLGFKVIDFYPKNPAPGAKVTAKLWIYNAGLKPSVATTIAVWADSPEAKECGTAGEGKAIKLPALAPFICNQGALAPLQPWHSARPTPAICLTGQPAAELQGMQAYEVTTTPAPILEFQNLDPYTLGPSSKLPTTPEVTVVGQSFTVTGVILKNVGTADANAGFGLENPTTQPQGYGSGTGIIKPGKFFALSKRKISFQADGAGVQVMKLSLDSELPPLELKFLVANKSGPVFAVQGIKGSLASIKPVPAVVTVGKPFKYGVSVKNIGARQGTLESVRAYLNPGYTKDGFVVMPDVGSHCDYRRDNTVTSAGLGLVAKPGKVLKIKASAPVVESESYNLAALVVDPNCNVEEIIPGWVPPVAYGAIITKGAP